MADALDMSLDDLISKSRSTHQRPRGRGPASEGGGPGPTHTAPRRHFNSCAAAAPYLRRAAFFFKTHSRPMVYAGYRAIQPQPPMVSAIDEPTKLYISNLDYGVSNDDIKELFSDVGDIKRYSINYDRSGGSKGTAEVIFSRRSDALAAVKRYNNVQLDGKPMKIEIMLGQTLRHHRHQLLSSPSIRQLETSICLSKVGLEEVVLEDGLRVEVDLVGVGMGEGEGRGEKVSAEDLDAVLDKYHAAAMETS